MIERLLRDAIDERPDAPFIVAPSGAFSFQQFHRYAASIASALDGIEPAPARIACHAPDSPSLVAVLLAAALGGRSIVLFNYDYTADQLEPLISSLGVELLLSGGELGELPCRQLRIDEVVDPAALSEAAEPRLGVLDGDGGELLVLTSGTTGTPKCARYLWEDLVAQIVPARGDGDERWLLAYRLNHFAGIQMLLHVLVNRQTLVLPESPKVGAALEAAKAFGVTHLSSTPTFWRFAFAALRESTLSLRSITLGSEAVSGELLDALAERFPAARIVHVYATTEAGSCVSVSDRKPGLPVSVLSRPPDARVQFRIEEDELLVRTNHGMLGYLDLENTEQRDAASKWIRTGDLVKIKDGRILFIGRKSEVINVGGVKVHPQEVEDLITALPGVKIARVYGKANPIAGQIVAVDIIVNDGFVEEEVEDSVFAACRQLNRQSRPRLVDFVDALSTNNYKLERR